MPMNFDPMTGKPLGGEVAGEPKKRFDPMTGELLEGTPKGEPKKQFDPMTGKPLGGTPEEESKKQFDPMTGKPLEETPKGEPVKQFDPMTGELLGQAQKKPEGRFDPMTGKPIGEKKASGKKWMKLAGVVAAVLVAVIILAVNIVPRIIYGKNYPVLQAVANFRQGNHLMENLNFADAVAGGKYTVVAEGDVEGAAINAACAVNAPDKKASAEGGISYQGFNVDFAAAMDEKEILLSIPQISSATYRYSYVEEKDGYIVELLEQGGIDVEEFDEMLRQTFATNQKEQAEKLKKASKEMLGLLDFEKSGKRDVKIDGKMRECKGYSMCVDEDVLKDMLEIVESVADRDMLEKMGRLNGYGSYDIFSELDDAIEDARFDLFVYVYKKQMAAIVVEADGGEIAVEFHGGNTPWENTTVETDGEGLVMELTGSVNQNVEEVELSFAGDTVMEYTYDYKAGDLELDFGSDYERVSLEANVLKSGDGCTFAIDDISGDGVQGNASLKMTVKKGADLAEVSKEDVVDIGNAGEGDWQKIMMGLFSLGGATMF